MTEIVEARNLFLADHGWLKSRFHFSFAEYYNPANVHFGVLRVLNDDIVAPGTGFGTHPHRDMEIVTYVVEGCLTHKDSMGHERSLGRGNVQYLSAGTGITHSEYNPGETPLRFLQIWILPDRANHKPAYGEAHFAPEERRHRWLHLVSSRGGGAPVELNQDANFYVTETDREIEFALDAGRQAYLVLIEGRAQINGQVLETRDALTAQEETLRIVPEGQAHVILIEMARAA